MKLAHLIVFILPTAMAAAQSEHRENDGPANSDNGIAEHKRQASDDDLIKDAPVSYGVNFDTKNNAIIIEIDSALPEAERKKIAASLTVRLLPKLMRQNFSRIEIKGFYDSGTDVAFPQIRNALNLLEAQTESDEADDDAEKAFDEILGSEENEESDPAKLFGLLKKLADGGNRIAAERLADLYAKTPFGTYATSFKDDALAEKYALKAASLGSADYAEILCEKYAPYPQKMEELVQAISPHCNNPEIAAICLEFFLGYQSPVASAACTCSQIRFAPDFNARSKPADKAAAYKAAQMLADANPASDMCAPLADAYLNGIGTDKNAETAYILARIQEVSDSNTDLALARLYLAHAYEHGEGASKNRILAEEYFNAALEDDSHPISSAIVDAARRFYNGYAAPKDKGFAVKILEAFIARPDADYGELNTTAITRLAEIYSGKYSFADMNAEALEKVNRRAAALELQFAENKIAEYGLNKNKIPSAEEICAAFAVKRISSRFTLDDTLRMANYYYITEPEDNLAIMKLKAFIDALNAVIAAESLPDVSLRITNRQNKTPVEFQFENGDIVRIASHSQADADSNETIDGIRE